MVPDNELKYNLDEMVTFEQITIPHAKGAFNVATMKPTQAKEKPKYEIESREQDGLQIFRLVDKSSIKYMEKILKQYHEHIERTQRNPDYIYMSMDTLRHIAQEVKPWDFVPGPDYRLSNSTLYGMKMRISESVPDGDVYLIREENWI